MRICENNTCTVCGKPFKWSKRNWIREHELPEVELITTHADCRYKMRRLTERKEKLESELLNVEYEIFALFNKDKPKGKVTATEDAACPLLINGTFYIEH